MVTHAFMSVITGITHLFQSDTRPSQSPSSAAAGGGGDPAAILSIAIGAMQAIAPPSPAASCGEPASLAPSRVLPYAEERAALVAEHARLCGDASNGEIDRAWKSYEARRSLVTGASIPDITSAEAHAHYQSTNARRIEIENKLDQIRAFSDSLSGGSISAPAKALIDSYKIQWRAEIGRLCGSGSDGMIDRAWKAYEGKLREFSSESPEVREAHSQYKILDDRRMLISEFLGNADAYIAAGDMGGLTDKLPLFRMLEREIRTTSELLEAEHHRLCGPHWNGEIDRAWKVYDALLALDQYRTFDVRRQTIESRIREIDNMPRPGAPLAIVVVPPPRVVTGDFPSAKTLIESYGGCWNDWSKSFRPLPFKEEEFKKLAAMHNELYKPVHNPATDFGFIEKRVVEPNTKIFVRADLHGDLKSLLENLRTLQAQGLLDATFKCNPNVQLVFLGDYGDRGSCSMEVLQLLLTLRLENPGQITLIRGNHESTIVNKMYCGADPNFKKFLFQRDGRTENKENTKILNDIYETMALSMFMGEQTPDGNIQYTVFTHGLFELYADPFPMLNSENRAERMAIPKAPEGDLGVEALMSERVRSLPSTAGRDYKAELAATADKPTRKLLKQAWAAQTMRHLMKVDNLREDNITAYNWGDMGPELHDPARSYVGSMGMRSWRLSAEEVKQYLRVASSSKAKVKLVFRGHEHEKQHHSYKGKMVATTLPVGMESFYKDRFPEQMDTGYILTTAPKISGWQKQAILRAPGASVTEVKAPCLLRSQEV